MRPLQIGIVLLLNVAFLFSFMVIGAHAGTVTRGLSDTTANPSQYITVTLVVDVDSGEDFYLLDDQYPAAFILRDTGSLRDDEAGHLKMVVVSNPSDASYQYIIEAPTETGNYSFSGDYGFDGMAGTQGIAGQAGITVTDCLDSEICNGIDDTCDGNVDEGFDADGDGYFPDDLCTGYASYDCNNNNASIYSGAAENCEPVDMNCNGELYDDLSCSESPIIITTDYFNGKTTNFSAMDNFSHVQGIVLERLGYGVLSFRKRVNFTKAVNLRPSAGVELSRNMIRINTTRLPFFNRPANITFFNLTFNNPFILRDGESCPSSICSNLSVSGNNISFQVSGFSEYSIQGRCGDGTVYGECSSPQPWYCDDGELVNNCNICGCPSGYSCIGGSCSIDNGGGNVPGGASPPGGGNECADGQTQACGTSVGVCMTGTTECIDGQWSECSGSIEPGTELCDGLDNDCDGFVDENLTCECLIGEKLVCGSNIGECQSGNRSCENGQWSSACFGSVGPKIELCDGLDNDCDGEIDDNCTVPEAALCWDGKIPETGCFCSGELYSEGYCYSGVFHEKPLEPFPWILLVIFGGILLAVLIAEVIHKSHEKSEKVTWESLEHGIRNMPMPPTPQEYDPRKKGRQ